MSTKTKGQLSVWRIVTAFCTCGLSIFVVGIRKSVADSKVLRTA